MTAVTATTPDSINLSHTRGELAKLQPFLETEYVQVHLPHYVGGVYSLAGDFYSDPMVVGVKHEQSPAGELAVQRGARVEASDGRVGRVDEFLVDPDTERVTHLVMRKGHLWGKRDVTIPVSAIDHLEENTIYLKLDKDQVGALPVLQ
ncbi:MAG: PRC-barrel domain-containing protein [Anaerolineae bacterium]